MKRVVRCAMCCVLCFTGFADAKIVDRIVAVVNNDVVTLYDLDRTALIKPKAPRDELLEDLISQKLLEQEMEKTQIEVTDDDLARAIANVLQKNQINIEILRAELATKGISFEAYKDQLRQQIRQMKFLQQIVGPQADAADYDEEIRHYTTGLRRKAYIDIRLSP